MSIITRFPPSPTGYLHVGGARTALFNWLYAKANNGKMVLRIEDTDLERSTQEAIDVILEAMQWLGLDWEEGPYYQTKRFDRYKEVIEQLLQTGHAYRCYCSKERLDEVRETQRANGEKPRYDGYCLENSPVDENSPYVIRFKNPRQGSVVFDDQVRGQIEVQNSELDDLIIARSDGSPTYNLCVVVDDIDMNITHVMRGDDHINNTVRQINIFKALGASLPVFAHIPLILGPDGARLSKRHGAVSVLQYRDEGILPQALLNYLVRLGWSHGDQEIFSVQEMIEHFDIKHVSQSPASFDQAKLLWLNQHYIKSIPITQLKAALEPFAQHAGIDIEHDSFIPAIELVRDRCDSLITLIEQIKYFVSEDVVYDEKASEQHFTESSLPYLQQALMKFSQLDEWQGESINLIIKEILKENDIKMPKLAIPLRVAVAGTTATPSIDLTLAVLGKAKTVDRIEKAVKIIEKTA